jgi:Cdc6-like AAA superfamily ATPase
MTADILATAGGLAALAAVFTHVAVYIMTATRFDRFDSQAMAWGALGGVTAFVVFFWWLVNRLANNLHSVETVTVSATGHEALLAAMAENVPMVESPAGDTAVWTWANLPLDVEVWPHVLIVGSTGAGKSVTLNAVCERLAERYPLAQWLICDYGGAEWKNAQAKTAESISQTLTALSDMVQERLMRYEGNVPSNERLFVVLEEFESVLDDLKVSDA